MEQISVNVKTWSCTNPDCEYRWQFEGDALNTSPFDLSPQQLIAIFPTLIGLPAGNCPNCHMRGLSFELYPENQPEKMAQINVAGDDELEATLVPEFDGDTPVLEQTGEIEKLGVVNGQVGVVTTPVFEQKLREATPQEVQELKQQRDKELQTVERIAV